MHVLHVSGTHFKPAKTIRNAHATDEPMASAKKAPKRKPGKVSSCNAVCVSIKLVRLPFHMICVVYSMP